MLGYGSLVDLEEKKRPPKPSKLQHFNYSKRTATRTTKGVVRKKLFYLEWCANKLHTVNAFIHGAKVPQAHHDTVRPEQLVEGDVPALLSS